MTVFRLSRRALLGALVFAPTLALAQPAPRFGGVTVDVSPLQRYGDTMDASFFARELPGYLARSFAPYIARGRGPMLVVRIDSVQYGAVGAATLPGSDATVDNIEATAIIGRSQTPFFIPMVTRVDLNDITGEAARTRMRNLALGIAQWLPGKLGLYR